jgi:hypothetical protein
MGFDYPTTAQGIPVEERGPLECIFFAKQWRMNQENDVNCNLFPERQLSHRFLVRDQRHGIFSGTVESFNDLFGGFVGAHEKVTIMDNKIHERKWL